MPIHYKSVYGENDDPIYIQRFFGKVEFTNSCWLWRGSTPGNRYGQFYGLKGQEGAHRISYRLRYGEIPKELQIDHLCKIKNCVNPEHLEPVTASENLKRSRIAEYNYLITNKWEENQGICALPSCNNIVFIGKYNREYCSKKCKWTAANFRHRNKKVIR